MKTECFVYNVCIKWRLDILSAELSRTAYCILISAEKKLNIFQAERKEMYFHLIQIYNCVYASYSNQNF